jgi:hypothetical protein
MKKYCQYYWAYCNYMDKNTQPLTTCTYEGYCDHQLPKDSRLQPLMCNPYIPPYTYTKICLCGGEGNIMGTCNKCGLPKA